MDNPAAFPRPIGTNGGGHTSYEQDGMSLRDYFAAKAMQAEYSYLGEPNISAMGDVARRAYIMANAMLAARESIE